VSTQSPHFKQSPLLTIALSVFISIGTSCIGHVFAQSEHSVQLSRATESGCLFLPTQFDMVPIGQT